MKVLFVVLNILGNVAFSRNMIMAVNKLPGIESSVVCFENTDYTTKTPPWILKPYIPSYIVKNKIGKTNDRIDLVIFQSIHLTPCLLKLIKKIPAIVSHDQTPASSFRLIVKENQSFINKVNCYFKNLMNRFVYHSVMNNVKLFMPWTRYCADSLVRDYHVSEKKILVAPGYIDAGYGWTKCQKGDFAAKKLLFVGNDFKRKGGELLICIMRHLGSSYTLKIVSNDRLIERYALPSNITVISKIRTLSELKPLYEEAGLFVFPTRREQMGVVLMESAMAGLPAIATDVGGVSEIVKDTLNGILMPFESSPEEWSEEIRKLFDTKGLLQSMSQTARKYAEDNFTEAAYVDKIKEGIQRVSG